MDFSLLQFQYVSGCRRSLNDGIMHEIEFVTGGRRELGYGYNDMDQDFAFHFSVQQKVVEAIFPESGHITV